MKLIDLQFRRKLVESLASRHIQAAPARPLPGHPHENGSIPRQDRIQSVSMDSSTCLRRENIRRNVSSAVTAARRDAAATTSQRLAPLLRPCAQPLASRSTIHVKTTKRTWITNKSLLLPFSSMNSKLYTHDMNEM